MITKQLIKNFENTISNCIGWMTFEDILNCSKEFSTITDQNEAHLITGFFKERNIF